MRWLTSLCCERCSLGMWQASMRGTATVPAPDLSASMPASRMAWGVSKSGSPAAREMTSWPASRMDAARSDRCMVLEGLRPATAGFRIMSTPAPLPALPGALPGAASARGMPAARMDGGRLGGSLIRRGVCKNLAENSHEEQISL